MTKRESVIRAVTHRPVEPVPYHVDALDPILQNFIVYTQVLCANCIY